MSREQISIFPTNLPTNLGNGGDRGSMGGGGGREGDWECGGCRNRNYAFRSICNRCKQPRLLVDIKTPADSKWFPRIGDWICAGCSNNNYASREMCKKCGQPKNESTLPANAMPEASLPTYAHYFAKVQGLHGLRMNYEMMGSVLQQSFPPYSNWPYSGIANKYGGLLLGSNWPFGGNNNGSLHGHGGNQPLEVPKGWRNGDWLCTCGFHNYSSRTECKKCNAPLPSISSMTKSTTSDLFPALGTKRLASEEFINDLDNKRLNAGVFNSNFFENSHHSYQGFEQFPGSTSNDISGNHSMYSGGDASKITNVHMQPHSPQNKMMPALIGKGAKQWRDGDWMCTNCNNHNFASRSSCNRCKTERESSSSRPIDVA